MGDCMIFLAVLMLGRKNGAIAAALGGALSDLLAGAAVWILPALSLWIAFYHSAHDISHDIFNHQRW